MIRALNSVLSPLLLTLSVIAISASASATEASSNSPLAGTSEDRIIAFGDVHGGATELRALLQALTLIDSSDNWTGGRTRLVSLGDLLDRGPDSRAVMDLLMSLETQAAKVGGAVYLVLGNHELMNLTGDLRYVSDGEYSAFAADEDPSERAGAYRRFKAEIEAAAPPERQPLSRIQRAPPPEMDVQAAFDEQFPPGFFAHRAAFAADGPYGSWLLSKPQILVLDRIAFVHGGLSQSFVSQPIGAYNEQSAEALRALLAAGDQLVNAGRLRPWEDLVSSRPAEEGSSLPDDFMALRDGLQFKPMWPSWYRGTAACHPLIERPRFEAVLAARNLDRIVMGHTPTNPRVIQTRFEDRAVLADTGMYVAYYRGRPSAAIFDQGSLRTLTLLADGTLAERRAKPAVDLRAQHDEQWLGNVRAAIGQLTLRTGEPVVFEANGRRLEVVWQKDNRRARSARLAAFALDKLLGFGLVAPAFLIEQNGREGVAEVLPATALSETSRATGNVFRPNFCHPGDDFSLLLVLDALMGQERDGDNLAYDRAHWLMYLTEHQRAFPKHERLPRYLSDQSAIIPPLVEGKLRSLNEAILAGALGELLDERQIQAILARRDLLLSLWSEPAPDT